ncbi:MAG: flagellar biosynthesis protein FlhB [Solirubrobacteraceae bacterium]|nr:flagellar biosynthesis protein FlhB [Patulibacter sp.]
MADKTEKATPKRQEEARNKGQVAKSQDLSGSVVLLAGLFAISIFGAKMVSSMKDLLEGSLKQASKPDELQGAGLDHIIRGAIHVAFSAIIPIAGTCALAAAAIMVAQVGLKLTPKAVKPDFKKLNPMSNAKHTFGPNALVELVKNLAKVSSIGLVVYIVLKPQISQVGTLVGMEPEAMGGVLITNIKKVAISAGAAYFVIGAADWVWQKHQLDKSLKMDKQEIKEEHKSSELPPEVRQAMRRRAMQASRARMMADVPTADVVVTNPTHYAVALKYDPELAAPIVVAKGMDLVAKKIREIAAEADVMIVPDPPLARGLHAAVEVGQHIPEEMYEAVAAVLAFVYRTARRKASLA